MNEPQWYRYWSEETKKFLDDNYPHWRKSSEESLNSLMLVELLRKLGMIK